MCRKITFAGTCEKCAKRFTWHELTQDLSCLEAKNNRCFGDCSNGVDEQEVLYDRECDDCERETKRAAEEEKGGSNKRQRR